MRKTTATLILMLVAGTAGAAELTAGLNLGFAMAPAGEFTLEAADFAEGLPFSLRVGVAYARPEAGDALAARRVFINNNTNGTPESSAKAWSGRVDLVKSFDSAWLRGAQVFAGPRFAKYSANFEYVGGNENFDVTSEQWGWGGGLEWRWPMGRTLDFSLGGGVDYYLASGLTGHDTTYEPDGPDINAREDYDYDAADEAVDQPELEWRLVVGVSRSFGS